LLANGHWPQRQPLVFVHNGRQQPSLAPGATVGYNSGLVTFTPPNNYTGSAIFVYTGSASFVYTIYQASNYWVDVVFQQS